MKKLIALFLICTSCYAGEPTPTPTPTPSPEPEHLSLRREPWLTPGTTDPTSPNGTNPGTTFFISKHRVIVTKLGDSYLITFEP